MYNKTQPYEIECVSEETSITNAFYSKEFIIVQLYNIKDC